MKIEIWSDYACPFCYIGKRNFEEAIRQSGMKDEIQVMYRSFELSPDAPRETDDSINEMLSKKYGMSIEEAKKNSENISQNAKASGIGLNFDKAKPTNTFDAHRLSHYAMENGRISEYNEAVFRSYFTDGLNISDHELLSELADEAGLDKEKAKSILSSSDYADVVRESEREAQKRGIDGVPFFIFENGETLFGAHPVETLLKNIRSDKK